MPAHQSINLVSSMAGPLDQPPKKLADSHRCSVYNETPSKGLLPDGTPKTLWQART